MNRTPVRLAALAAVAVLALAGCGSSDDSSKSSGSQSSDSSSASSSPSSSPSESKSASKSASAPSSKAASQSSSITITDYKYMGASKVKPGATIKVTNKDTEAHTVTADSGNAFDVTIPPGKTVSMKAPTKAGTYAYHCNFHSNMKGSLTVG